MYLRNVSYTNQSTYHTCFMGNFWVNGQNMWEMTKKNHIFRLFCPIPGNWRQIHVCCVHEICSMGCTEYDHKKNFPINCRKKIIFIHILAYIDHFLPSNFGIRGKVRFFFEIFFFLARSTSFGLNRKKMPGDGKFKKKIIFWNSLIWIQDNSIQRWDN